MSSANPASYAGTTTGLSALTTVHLAVIAVFAVFAILAILYGVRLRARRKAAEAQIAERNATVEREVVPPTEAPGAGETVEERLPEEVGRLRTPPPEPVHQPDLVAEPSPLADEPIAAAAPMDASPASLAADLETPTPASAPVETAPAYCLTDLKGLGPKVATRLAELGIDTVPSLAALSDAEAAALDAQLGPFAGRMERDRWREQARLLAAGDKAGFEAAFGKL